MAELVNFHFDPACPWAWQTALWMREVERVRPVEIEWRLFSLKTANAPGDDRRSQATPALRALALVRRRSGNDGVARLYASLGARIHDGDQKPTRDVVGAALEDAGFPAGLVDEALADESTAAEVRADHDRAVEAVGAFGVPTIILPSGKGMFGPVVATAPRGEAAGELWDRVRYLIELDGFFELKRDRDRRPGTS